LCAPPFFVVGKTGQARLDVLTMLRFDDIGPYRRVKRKNLMGTSKRMSLFGEPLPTGLTTFGAARHLVWTLRGPTLCLYNL